MGVLGAIGNAFLDSLESTAKRESSNKNFSEDVRQQYSDFGSALHRMRQGETYSDGDNDDDILNIKIY